MIFRTYLKSDSETIREMLFAEGLKYAEMTYEAGGHETFVMTGDDGKLMGFFTIVPLRKVWFVQHFCLGKEYRTFKNASTLERFMRTIIVGEKHSPIMVLNIPENRYDLKTMVEFKYRAKPYEQKDGNSFYGVNLLEVRDGI